MEIQGIFNTITARAARDALGVTPLLAASDASLLREFGYVANGESRPLSSVTQCAGETTTGWTLSQWQKIFPFAKALSDEIDGCALVAVLNAKKVVSADGVVRSSITLPPGVARSTTPLDCTDVYASIRGSGRGATTVRFYVEGGFIAIRQGNFDTAQGQPLAISDICFENMASNTAGSVGFFVRHNRNAGLLQALVMQNVIWRNFTNNYLWNVGRGLAFDHVVIFGPDYAKQPNGGITVVGTVEATYGMFSHRYNDVLLANYRWGWDYQVSKCAIEGQAFTACAAYNGDGMVNVNCDGFDNSGNSGYKSLLWSFDNCDWEGVAYAYRLRNCRNVRINNGFYIYSQKYTTQRLYAVDNSELPAGIERCMIELIDSDDVKTDKVEFAAADMTNSSLVNVNPGCRNVLFADSVVRTYSTANAGFRLSGAIANTTVEKNTRWADWGGGSKIVYGGSGDVARQISYTDVAAAGGTVTDDGFYTLAGGATFQSDAGGVIQVTFPKRANGRSFFAQPPIVILTGENSNTYAGAPALKTRTADGFSAYAPNGAANYAIGLDWSASARI